MEYRELLSVALDFATAILLGALVGIEREKRKSEEEGTHHIAGLRTFILLAMFGAAAGYVARSLSAPWIFAASLLIVGALVVTGYLVSSRTSQNGKGLTTEVAAVIVFLLGGLASSTAVTLSFAKEGRENPQISDALASGILLAWAVMFVRVLVLVAVVNRALLGPLLMPFLIMAAVVAGFAGFHYYRDRSSKKRASAKSGIAVRNPFSLTSAAKFGALFAVILLAVKIVQETMPPSVLYAVAALSGLVDVDAITLSMAELARSGEAQVAVVAITIAALSNTVVKCGMVVVAAGLALGKPILIATLATLVAGLSAALLT
jgi:uncharacterized membrane protein (DUF4010 family)